MQARVEHGYGIIELDMSDGYHVGTTVTVTLDQDDVPVVEIMTPQDTETHELIRVWLNDARATSWRLLH